MLLWPNSNKKELDTGLSHVVVLVVLLVHAMLEKIVYCKLVYVSRYAIAERLRAEVVVVVV